MKKGQFLTLVLTGLVLLSLVSCGKTTTEVDETGESFEAYYQSVSNDDIVFENEVCFVDSQILLTAADGVSQSQISELVKEQDGTVVGYISISNDYQIEFADGKTSEELDVIIGDWENNDSVEAVSLNYASQFGADSIDYTNDPWIDADNPSDTSGSEWSETAPEGNNWWAEAIMMPSVWNMDAEFQTVKVGIYDTMFDTDNEDLTDIFADVWNAPEDENGNCTVTSLYSSAKQANQKTTNYEHGTHVAGLIAAKAENNFGISGVSQNAQLYGFSYMTTATDTEYASQWGNIFELKYSIALMLSEGAKVINFSIGMDELLVAAQHGVASALETLAVYSSSMEQFLLTCLNSGYDFLIVKSAGNQNGYSWTTCETSDDHPYGYKQDNTIVDNTDYDVQYDFLGAIEDETVKAHILIVGAVENHTDYYTTADFSVVGDRVDVYAPGVNILSDFPTNISGMATGTSMATPIVSGIASLVWGVNPDLSAVQVASIIRVSSSVSMFDADSHSLLFRELVDCTPIVNAYFAVQLALNSSGEGNNTTSTAGIITGIAYTTEDDGSLTALSDATVTVADSEGNTVEIAVTSNLSGYTFILPDGTYTITVELEGYETTSKKTSLTKNDVLSVDFEMEMVRTPISIDVSDYFESFADLVNVLNMQQTESRIFLSGNNAYTANGFSLEWSDNVYFMKNEYAEDILLYGIRLGDDIYEAEEILLNKSWVYFYSGEVEESQEYIYITVIDEFPYEICIYTDANGNITSWYLSNWAEQDNFYDVYYGSDNDNQAAYSDYSSYVYSNGERLSEFTIKEVDGELWAWLGFWINYGDSASQEDFGFTWVPGTYEYELVGQRSSTNYVLTFTPTNSGMNIRVVYSEGKGENWLTGEDSGIWIDEEYIEQ